MNSESDYKLAQPESSLSEAAKLSVELENIVAEREIREDAEKYVSRTEALRTGTEITDPIEHRAKKPAFELTLEKTEDASALAEAIGERSTTIAELRQVTKQAESLFENGRLKEPLPDLADVEAHIMAWESQYYEWIRSRDELKSKRDAYDAENPSKGWDWGRSYPPELIDHASYTAGNEPSLDNSRLYLKIRDHYSVAIPTMDEFKGHLTHISEAIEAGRKKRTANLELIADGQWPNPKTFQAMERQMADSEFRGYKTSPAALLKQELMTAGVGLHDDRYESDIVKVTDEFGALLSRRVAMDIDKMPSFGGAQGWLADIYIDESELQRNVDAIAEVKSVLGESSAAELEKAIGKEASLDRFIKACERMIPADLGLVHVTNETSAISILKSESLASATVTGKRNAAGSHTGGVHWSSPGYVSPGYGRFKGLGHPVMVGMALGDIIEETPIHNPTHEANSERLGKIEVGDDLPLALAKKLDAADRLIDSGLKATHVIGAENGYKRINDDEPYGEQYEMVFALAPEDVTPKTVATAYKYDLKKIHMLTDIKSKEVIDAELVRDGINPDIYEEAFAPVASVLNEPKQAIRDDVWKEDYWVHGSSLLKEISLGFRARSSKRILVAPIKAVERAADYKKVDTYMKNNQIQKESFL